MNRFTLLTLLAASIAAVGLSAPAMADENPRIKGNATGGGWVAGTLSGPPPTRAKARIVAAKVSIWDAYDALLRGKITQDEYDGIFDRHARAAHLDGPDPLLDTTLRPPSCGGGGDDPCPNAELAVPHAAQIESYYCGPASGVMVALYKGRRRSATTGARLTQRAMAGTAHMRTDAVGSTPYWSGNFTRGLNLWLYGPSGRGRYAQIDTPSLGQFKRALRFDVAKSMPVAVSTVEWASDGSYNRHRFKNWSTPIGHWIVARGYRAHGGRVLLLDPATSVWPGVRSHFTVSSRRLVTRYVDNGIAAA